MSLIKEEIIFHIDEVTAGSKADFVSFLIGDDEIVFFKIYNSASSTDEVYPHTYSKHQYCGGDIRFKSMKKYKFLYCDVCGFRIKIPGSIKTIEDLQGYFAEVKEPIEDRFEILDI